MNEDYSLSYLKDNWGVPMYVYLYVHSTYVHKLNKY